MNEQDQTAPPLEFKNRTAGLVVFGVIQILMGLFFLLMIPLMFLSLAVGPPTGMATDVRMIILMVVECGAFAVIGIWLGIGSILARRWARALTLVLAWIALVGGIFTLVFASLFMGDMFQQMAQQGKIPPGAVLVMQLIAGATTGCFYILLPGAFILFYQSKHVRVTCEAKDPRVRWTDKCPLPVLALCLLLGSGAFCMIASMLAFGAVMPWFGTFLEGPAALALMLANALLLAWLTWGMYKLKKLAWLGTIAFLPVWSASGIVTFSRGGLREMYERMHFPEEQLEMIENTGMLDNMSWMMGISCVVYLAYVLWVGKYFCSCSSKCAR